MDGPGVEGTEHVRCDVGTRRLRGGPEGRDGVNRDRFARSAQRPLCPRSRPTCCAALSDAWPRPADWGVIFFPELQCGGLSRDGFTCNRYQRREFMLRGWQRSAM